MVLEKGVVVVQDRRLALAFRVGALLVAAVALGRQVGLFRGTFSPRALMFYTIQSNLLAIILFTILVVATIRGLRQGPRGEASYLRRLTMVVTIDLLVTLVVFWGLLAPNLGLGFLLSFDNIAVHTLVPLLCLTDYIVFSKPGQLKYRDVYYACIFPLFYVLFVNIAAVAGYVYHFDDETTRFPYFFLDFDRLGLGVIAYIGAILVVFLGLAHLTYLLDRKVSLRKVSQQRGNNHGDTVLLRSTSRADGADGLAEASAAEAVPADPVEGSL
ncbi:MAG: Pr6Pr family membrane protein [Propionibacteriaceae bacterium]|jgi:hypothetical protein|nr:Pr6Pr family membrane protein [Propionibacteriaceae bacterium]